MIYKYCYFQVATGFIGANAFHFYYAGILLAIDTFGHIILGQLLLIIFIVSIFTNIQDGFKMNSISNISESKYLNNKCFQHNENNRNIQILIKIGLATSLTLSILITLGSTIATTILRRHLMVWAIFAPKVKSDQSNFLRFSLFYF